MSNAHGRSIDTTHLSIDTAEDRGFIHRDYIAHCFRWSHAARVAMDVKRKNGRLNVLDIGCGKDMPLPMMLWTNTIPVDNYCGVDYGNFEVPEKLASCKKFDVFLANNTDFAVFAESLQAGDWDLITCFEMLEHVEPAHGMRILQAIRKLCDEKTRVVISTPVYEARKGPADNHVSEWTYEALFKLIRLTQLHVDKNYGTFADWPKIEQLLAATYGNSAFDMARELKTYFCPDVMSNMFAPLFPRQSRNVCWDLSAGKSDKETFNTLKRELLDLIATAPVAVCSAKKEAFPELVAQITAL